MASCGLESERPVSKLIWHGPASKLQHARKMGPGSNSGENLMAEPSKQEIDARAYQLWEQAGRPEDREAEFWHLAEQELRNEDKGSPTRTPDTL